MTLALSQGHQQTCRRRRNLEPWHQEVTFLLTACGARLFLTNSRCPTGSRTEQAAVASTLLGPKSPENLKAGRLCPELSSSVQKQSPDKELSCHKSPPWEFHNFYHWRWNHRDKTSPKETISQRYVFPEEPVYL